MKAFWIVLALLYTLWPWDILPDLLPGAGWIDDVAVWILILQHLLRQERRTEAGRRYHRRRASAGTSGPTGPPPDGHRTSREVLGVPEDASPEEIKAAYRKLANQYHPDKVSHLGEEFQRLAETRFKEIQTAYRELMQQNR
jgi:DnaJ-domain-containing protein 1